MEPETSTSEEPMNAHRTKLFDSELLSQWIMFGLPNKSIHQGQRGSNNERLIVIFIVFPVYRSPKINCLCPLATGNIPVSYTHLRAHETNDLISNAVL